MASLIGRSAAPVRAENYAVFTQCALTTSLNGKHCWQMTTET
jgi:hypothetical protein